MSDWAGFSSLTELRAANAACESGSVLVVADRNCELVDGRWVLVFRQNLLYPERTTFYRAKRDGALEWMGEAANRDQALDLVAAIDPSIRLTVSA